MVVVEGISWQSSDYKTVLPMQRVWVQSLVREVDPTCHKED